MGPFYNINANRHTVYDALQIARALLNDNLGKTWADSVLFPLAIIAHGEVTLELNLNEIAVVNATSMPIIVPAGQLDLGNDQPRDLINPNRLMERDPGTLNSDYVEMFRAATVPQIDPTNSLIYWTWQQERIQFPGATSDREVLIEYDAGLVSPNFVTDTLGFIHAELYVGPRVAALAMASIGDPKTKMFNDIANGNLDKIMRYNVKEDQDLPVRRQAYRRGRRRRVY